MVRSLPLGYRALLRLLLKDSYSRHAIYVFILTFLCYTFYHASRRSISVAKNILHSGNFEDGNSPGWAPFNDHNWSQLIGSLEYAYLSVYALAMFLSGYIAERVSLRHFLASGMILSGVFNIAFGMAYHFDIHHFSYFMCVQLFSGLVQSTGWPAVVTVMGNWWGGRRRGLIMGLWNAHTSVGNILGSVVAGYYVDSDWGKSFIIPGWILIFGAILVQLTLINRPEDVNLQITGHKSPLLITTKSPNESSTTRFHSSSENFCPDLSSGRAITFKEALLLPNVLAYSILLFFAKLVSYTFLYWLPNYLALIEQGQVNSERAAQLSVLFDLGGIFGGILAGLFSDSNDRNMNTDIIKRRAITCSVMLALAAPTLVIYKSISQASSFLSLAFLFLCGLLINGPYALITTAVSADLGTQPALQGRGRALATVTAIIDSTGSLGAALGPLLTGLLIPFGWSAVFTMLVLADLSGLTLSLWIACRQTASIPNDSRFKAMRA